MTVTQQAAKDRHMQIRLATKADLPMLGRHKSRHSKENGRDGDPIFAPSEEEWLASESDFAREAEALARPIIDVGWTRIWILTDGHEVFGELTLTHRPPLKASLHRCLLMMGLERPVRKRGWGSKLISESLTWANSQGSLEWITLFVFENNPAAKALYLKFGFEAIGTTRDQFRVFGQSVDDTEMVLRLNPRPKF